MAIHGRVAPIDYAALEQIYRTKEQVKMMLVIALEKEKQAIYQEVVAQGIEQGFELGETHRAEQLRSIHDFRTNWAFYRATNYLTHGRIFANRCEPRFGLRQKRYQHRRLNLNL